MRDDFSQQTIDILAKRVGVRCSNPSCRKLTTGPRSDFSKIINIGVGAHITAAAPDGPRYDSTLTSDQRKSPQNGIWLCQNCAKLIDNDPSRYTVEILNVWKQRAETATLDEIQGVPAGGSNLDGSADVEVSYRKVNISQERHDYMLEITVQNRGIEAITDYHIDLEFPARVVEKPETHSAYVIDRSSHLLCFFRVSCRNAQDIIFPGDKRTVISVPYYIDSRMYMNRYFETRAFRQRGSFFDEPVRATLYRSGFQPVVVEKQFSELRFFNSRYLIRLQLFPTKMFVLKRQEDDSCFEQIAPSR